MESVEPDIHTEIHSISKNTVKLGAFGAEFSAISCIWLAHSTSTVSLDWPMHYELFAKIWNQSLILLKLRRNAHFELINI